MMKMKGSALYICAVLAGSAVAAVSPEEAARLGKDLTPMGAERAGNADGSIPEWNEAGTPIPANFKADSGDYTDPYAGEKPLYTVDADNWKEHAEFLTEGARAMFEKMGKDGFKMHVYPTKRDFVVPEWIYANTAKNATGATLVAEGQKIDGNYAGVPFPIPQTGLEVIWNHMTRYLADHTLDYDTYYVDSSGKPILSTTGYLTDKFEMYKIKDKPVGDTPWLKLRINYEAPARRAGEILLVHEPGADFTEGKGRQAWQYLVGQRRVRLAPAVSFDTPNPAVAGTSTYDDAFIYNGSPERYTWKLVGKKEVLIPYSCYEFLFKVNITDALGEKFLDPEVIRWEKHRVWVVEADLKPGMRHLYKKRRFYIDEDMWAGMASENYDARDNLWRVQFAYGANLYDIKSTYHFAYGAYDIAQGIYNLNSKPIPGKYRNGVTEGDNYFAPKGMARGGVR
jgi:hypothetical protein